MQIELTEEQANRLDRVRREFNAMTKKRMTPQQFAEWLFEEAIKGEEKAAGLSQKIRSVARFTVFGAGPRNVH